MVIKDNSYNLLGPYLYVSSQFFIAPWVLSYSWGNWILRGSINCPKSDHRLEPDPKNVNTCAFNFCVLKHLVTPSPFSSHYSLLYCHCSLRARMDSKLLQNFYLLEKTSFPLVSSGGPFWFDSLPHSVCISSIWNSSFDFHDIFKINLGISTCLTFCFAWIIFLPLFAICGISLRFYPFLCSSHSLDCVALNFM